MMNNRQSEFYGSGDKKNNSDITTLVSGDKKHNRKAAFVILLYTFVENLLLRQNWCEHPRQRGRRLTKSNSQVAQIVKFAL